MSVPSTQSSVVVGVDLGGTNVRVAAVLASGEILARHKVDTPRDGEAAEIIELIAGLVTRCIDASGRSAEGIGAAVPATFRPDGTFGKLPNLPALDGVDFRALMTERCGLAVELINDATAATAGEHWIGAARGFENVIGVTLGTGVGGGLVIEDRVFFGKDGTAGEIGHVCVEPNGIPCGCGSVGCVEQYSSGTAILRAALSAGIEADSPEDVYLAAKAGNDKAIEIFRSMGRYLGIALGGLVNVLDPDAIVIAGGVAAAWELFIGSLSDEVQKRAFPEPASRAKIIRASLGDDAGVLGAAKITFQRLGRV